MTDYYDDIIHLPHHVSKRHPQMSLYNRAAQFAPFAALAGYEEAIAETARQTSSKIEIMEDIRQLMDQKLSILCNHLDEEPIISITYFQPDNHKRGGCYVTVAGVLKDIRTNEHIILLRDGKKIPIDYIISLDGEVFSINKP
jgi:hypothetical protein